MPLNVDELVKVIIAQLRPELQKLVEVEVRRQLAESAPKRRLRDLLVERANAADRS